MPTLSFKGKSLIQNHHLSVKFHQLIPKKKLSQTDKVSLHDNLIIHGDNLVTLKALLPTYSGKIDCIYIDPPYNTGEEKWVYNDNVNHPMIKDWLGKTVDKDDLTRHDKWLCMMMPRLKLLRELLHPDGVIFISIDYNEQHHLLALMNEVFGEEYFKDVVIIRRGVKNVQAQFDTISALSNGYESIIMYCNNPSKRFAKLYEELDEEKDGSWNNHWRGTDRPTMRYDLFGIFPESGQWRWGEARSREAVKNYESLVQEFTEKGIELTQENIDKWYIQYVEDNEFEIDLLRLSENNTPEHYIAPTNKKLLSNLWYDLKPNGSNQLKKIFGKKVFDNPKSIDLIKRLIQFATDKKDAVILDSFAGSGSTAHAVLEMNKADNGNRRFILIEMEDYADSTTAERIRRVITGTKNSKKNGIPGTGGSFSYFELGGPIELESILVGKNGLPDYTELARYVFYTATGEEFDESKIDENCFYIGTSKKYDVFLIYKPDINYLKATALNLKMANSIASYSKGQKKKKLVFAPVKYVDNDTLINLQIDYCQIPFEIYKLKE